MMLNVGHLYFNPFYERGYIVWDKGPGAVVIDPGCCNGEEIQNLLDFLDSHKITVQGSTAGVSFLSLFLVLFVYV